MYLSHFGLHAPPFGITPNPAFFFAGSKRGPILEALRYAVVSGEGIVKVTGEVGSGKTMLCRMLESQLPAHVEVIYLVNPSLGREDVLHAIAGELGISTHGKRADEALRLLQNDLIDKHEAGKQVVLLVEEAQAMPLDTLEEIRLLSNLETASHKLLQIVLFGQPELNDNLSLSRMRQLRERITHNFNVPPLERGAVGEYLMVRMRAAGYKGPDIFTPAAIRMIAAASKGTVRRINILADKALLAAFASNAYGIDRKQVGAAIRDCEFPDRRPVSWRQAAAAGLGLAAIAGAALAWHGIQAGARAPAAWSAPATPVPAAAPAAVPVTAKAAAREDGAAWPPLLGQRLASTGTWLGRTAPQHYTIQTMLANAQNGDWLENLLQQAKGKLNINDIHLYATEVGGIRRLVVLYGNFETRAQANAAVSKLPAYWNGHVLIRTVQSVKNDIEKA